MRHGGVLSVACAILMASAAWPACAQTGGKSITIVLPEQPSNLEPCGSILTDVGQVLNQNITEPLTVINPENGTPQPRHTPAEAGDEVGAGQRHHMAFPPA